MIPYLKRARPPVLQNWVARRSGQSAWKWQKWNVFRLFTFFKIIGKVVDSEHKHHFHETDFWMNYFDRGEVTEARVILGSKDVMRFKIEGQAGQRVC